MKGGGHGVGAKGWWEEKDGTGVKVNEGNRVEVNKGQGERGSEIKLYIDNGYALYKVPIAPVKRLTPHHLHVCNCV